MKNDGRPFEAVIAAAGASSRMGEWKLLLPCRGATVVESTVADALGAGLEAIVVAGHRADELEALFGGRALVRVVRNPTWEDGMASSMLAGLRAARGAWVFLMLADLPFAGSDPYRLLADERARRFEAGLPEAPLAAAFRGTKGHPVLVPRLAALEAAERAAFGAAGGTGGGDGGSLREAFRALGGLVPVETGIEGVLLDLDTPEDRARLLGGRE
ncbi:MAG TPA: NTP transferase domain-containing protein [Spirochaetales bacterium]|nr:NTP transferase domain-containing protein [Spirochaetales bacterium]